MNDFLPLIGLILGLLIIGYSVYDLISNKHLNKRQKTNCMFLFFIIPAVGSLIYFALKPSFANKEKSHLRQYNL